MVCLLAKVQKYYLNSLLNRAFLEFLSHGIYGGAIGSEDYGFVLNLLESSLYDLSSTAKQFLPPDKRPGNESWLRI